jgi:hypothetical protein
MRTAHSGLPPDAWNGGPLGRSAQWLTRPPVALRSPRPSRRRRCRDLGACTPGRRCPPEPTASQRRPSAAKSRIWTRPSAAPSSLLTLRWRTESRANPSLKHLPVGVQAIELSTGGMGAIKKIRDQPPAPPPKHVQAAADRCSASCFNARPFGRGEDVFQ